MFTGIDDVMMERFTDALLESAGAAESGANFGQLGALIKEHFAPDEYSDLLDLVLPLAASDVLTKMEEQLAPNIGQLAAQFFRDLGI